MQKVIIFLLLIVMIQSQCTCNQFTSQTSCEAYTFGYCLFIDGSCQMAECQNIPYQENCIAPKCLWSNNQCNTFISSQLTCEQLLPQQCDSYWGCYYDYTLQNCSVISQCSQLKIDQCNGKTIQGNNCVVDPIENVCVEMTSCNSLTTQFECESQYPVCSFKDENCELLTCSEINDQQSCTYLDQCEWKDAICQERVCSDSTTQDLCNDDYCGWNNNKCFQCDEINPEEEEEEEEEDKYGLSITASIICLILIYI